MIQGDVFEEVHQFIINLLQEQGLNDIKIELTDDKLKRKINEKNNEVIPHFFPSCIGFILRRRSLDVILKEKEEVVFVFLYKY